MQDKGVLSLHNTWWYIGKCIEQHSNDSLPGLPLYRHMLRRQHFPSLHVCCMLYSKAVTCGMLCFYGAEPGKSKLVFEAVCGRAGGLSNMPSKEGDAHMLSTLMQVQDFLHVHRLVPRLPAEFCTCAHATKLSNASAKCLSTST